MENYNPNLYQNRYNTNINTNYIKDYGLEPIVVNIDAVSKQNNTFRTALWTGEHLQVTVMSIGIGESIGLECHPNTDQFIKVVQGTAFVMMGDEQNNLTYQKTVPEDFAIMVPAGKWHNITNVGRVSLKLYSIYAPPQHPRGTVHNTKADSQY